MGGKEVERTIKTINFAYFIIKFKISVIKLEYDFTSNANLREKVVS